MEFIKSRDNSRLKAVRALFRDRTFRHETGAFPTEGLRLTAEAVRLGHRLSTLFVSEGALSRYGEEIAALADVAGESFCLPDHLMDKLGETRTPQGVVGVFPMPAQAEPPLSGSALLLCHLQEPGNVGAILRTANAFGVHAVLTADCPDPYSPKVLRASMGGVLGGGWSAVEEPEGYIAARKGVGSAVYATVLRGDSCRVADADLRGALVLLGNEGAGLPEALIALADRGLYIPIGPQAESLGVAMAAGIVAYEMTRGGVPLG